MAQAPLAAVTPLVSIHVRKLRDKHYNIHPLSSKCTPEPQALDTCMTMSLHIPDEICIHIMTFLGSQDIWASLHNVNHQWRRLSEDYMINPISHRVSNGQCPIEKFGKCTVYRTNM